MNTFFQTHFNLLLDAIQVWHVALIVIALFVILLVKAVKLTLEQQATNLNSKSGSLVKHSHFNDSVGNEWHSSRINAATGIAMFGLLDSGGNSCGTGSIASLAFDPGGGASIMHHESFFNLPSSESQTVNPSNGFPMVGGVDVAGNAYGFSN